VLKESVETIALTAVDLVAGLPDVFRREVISPFEDGASRANPRGRPIRALWDCLIMCPDRV
jgi:hypothetical protein